MGPIQIFILGFGDDSMVRGIADELAGLRADGTIEVVDVRVLLRVDDDVIALGWSDLADRDDCRCLDELRLLCGDMPTARVLGADGALGVGNLGIDSREFHELTSELAIGETILLLVIGVVWADRLAAAIRDASVVSAQQDFLSPGALVALGSMLGFEVAPHQEPETSATRSPG